MKKPRDQMVARLDAVDTVMGYGTRIGLALYKRRASEIRAEILKVASVCYYLPAGFSRQSNNS